MAGPLPHPWEPAHPNATAIGHAGSLNPQQVANVKAVARSFGRQGQGPFVKDPQFGLIANNPAAYNIPNGKAPGRKK